MMKTVTGATPAGRPSPGSSLPETKLDARQRHHAAGLMRVNHTGEMCAQALYEGQAALAQHTGQRDYLRETADEETDHLAWCAQRLRQLHSKPSALGAFWYTSSYAMGALVALAGDKVSLGFVVETERQVEKHLEEHLSQLPENDQHSRAILQQMKSEEIKHAKNARDRGGITLPFPVPQLMRASAMIMKTVAYRL